jgi:hypothetical protein
MNITDITLDYRIKPSKTSITVKDQNGKTKGIITDCKTFQNMSDRDRFDLHSKLKKSGINSLDIATNCVIKNGDVYYLYNISLKKFIQQYGAYSETEQNKLDKMEAVIEMVKQCNIPVIECLFIA